MLKKRTVVTALSIAAIVVAGGAAVAANVGILNAADNTPMGTLSAEADLATVAAPSSSSTAAATPAGTPQRFVVESAGQVEVLRDGAKLTLGEVLPSAGWQARPGAVTSDSAEVTFTSGTDELVFTATLAGDGTVTGAAKRPGQSVETIPQAPATASTDGHDDDHADSDHADDDHDRADHDAADHDKGDHDNKSDDHEDKDHDSHGEDDDD
ncbi:MAG: hypothetical protein IPH29_03125 [Candidatus Microthrix sp.]|nr:hypothetical protein [Candidatus Microthrix sp.]